MTSESDSDSAIYSLGKGEAVSSILTGSTSKKLLHHRLIGGVGMTGIRRSCAERVVNAQGVLTSQWQSAFLQCSRRLPI